jgi:hypothetical protein
MPLAEHQTEGKKGGFYHIRASSTYLSQPFASNQIQRVTVITENCYEALAFCDVLYQ